MPRTSPIPGLPAGLPFETFTLDIGGREWTIEAVSDQSALAAASDAFHHFPFGLLLWDSAPVLAYVLAARRALLNGRTVLELGCGVGLAGLMAQWLGADVTQTDHGGEALSLARHNAERNGISGIAQREADWTRWQDTASYDLIIGSDILYEPELHGAVLAILECNLAAGGTVLITDPGRPTTPPFLQRMKTAGWTVASRRSRVPALVPTRPGETVVVTVIEARQG